jgi:hypothetical protein
MNNSKKQLVAMRGGKILCSFTLDTESTYMQGKASRKINEEKPETVEKAKVIAWEVCRMLNINEKFKTVCPALSEEEFNGLEALILKDGKVIMPIILWNDNIVDGHKRYEIAIKHNIPFTTTGKEFASEEEALIWIIENQMSRRNLNDFQRIELALKKEAIIAAQAKERQKTGLKQNSAVLEAKEETNETNKTLGKMAGVGKETIRKVKVILKEGTEEQKEKLRAGEVKIDKVYKELKPKAKPNPEPGFTPNPGLIKEIIEAGTKALAKKYHPDVGGDESIFNDLCNTREYLMFFHDCYQESPNDN